MLEAGINTGTDSYPINLSPKTADAAKGCAKIFIFNASAEWSIGNGWNNFFAVTTVYGREQPELVGKTKEKRLYFPK